MSVNNRARHSKRSRRDFQIELEQAESLFVSPVRERRVVVLLGDIIDDGTYWSSLTSEEREERRRVSMDFLSHVTREVSEGRIRTVPLVTTAHSR